MIADDLPSQKSLCLSFLLSVFFLYFFLFLCLRLHNSYEDVSSIHISDLISDSNPFVKDQIGQKREASLSLHKITLKTNFQNLFHAQIGRAHRELSNTTDGFKI